MVSWQGRPDVGLCRVSVLLTSAFLLQDQMSASAQVGSSRFPRGNADSEPEEGDVMHLHCLSRGLRHHPAVFVCLCQPSWVC